MVTNGHGLIGSRGRSALSSLLAFLLLLAVSSARAGDGHDLVVPPPQCPAALIKMAKAELEARLEHKSWMKRRYYLRRMAILKPAIHAELARLCPHPDRCSPEALRDAVAAAVEKGLKSANNWQGKVKAYGIFIGTVAANAALNVALMNFLPHDFGVITAASLTGVTASLITALGAPALEPLSAKIRQWAWGSGQPEEKPAPSTKLEKTYETVYRSNQEAFSSLATLGRSIIRSPLYQLQTIFSTCLQVSLINPEEGAKVSAALIAQLLVDLHASYPELDFAEPTFGNYAQAMYARRYVTKANFEPFVQSVLFGIQAVNADAPYTEGDKEYFRRILTAWLEPR